MSAGIAERSAEFPDLFAPQLRRERVVEWQAPGPAARAAMTMSGIEAMRAIRDGRLPPPPLAKLIGFRMATVEPGRIVMELDAEESLENTIGLLHGATAAALLDTAMGCAISTMLAAGEASVTLDLKLTYLRPLSVSGSWACSARHGKRSGIQFRKLPAGWLISSRHMLCRLSSGLVMLSLRRLSGLARRGPGLCRACRMCGRLSVAL